MPQKLGVDGNICEILNNLFEYTIKHRKIIEDDYGSQFEDYRDNDQEKRTKYSDNKLSKRPIHD